MMPRPCASPRIPANTAISASETIQPGTVEGGSRVGGVVVPGRLGVLGAVGVGFEEMVVLAGIVVLG